MIQSLDGGLVIAGSTRSFGFGGNDFWVLKTDAEGNISDTCPTGMIRESSASAYPVSLTVSDTSVSARETDAGIEELGIGVAESVVEVETQCTR